jgi:hypothetical protein
MGDPDAMKAGCNLINGSTSCQADLPKLQFGAGDRPPNVVGGRGAVSAVLE